MQCDQHKEGQSSGLPSSGDYISINSAHNHISFVEDQILLLIQFEYTTLKFFFFSFSKLTEGLYMRSHSLQTNLPQFLLLHPHYCCFHLGQDHLSSGLLARVFWVIFLQSTPHTIPWGPSLTHCSYHLSDTTSLPARSLLALLPLPYIPIILNCLQYPKPSCFMLYTLVHKVPSVCNVLLLYLLCTSFYPKPGKFLLNFQDSA